MEAMRAELTKLKSALSGDANTAVVAEKKPVESTGAPSSSPQRKEQATEKHPTGIDLGPVRAVPYGTIYFNAFGNSGGTNNADDPLFATPTNQGNVSMSVRQTRLGLKLEGPTVRNAKSRGQIEADFFGGFGPNYQSGPACLCDRSNRIVNFGAPIAGQVQGFEVTTFILLAGGYINYEISHLLLAPNIALLCLLRLQVPAVFEARLLCF